MKRGIIIIALYASGCVFCALFLSPLSWNTAFGHTKSDGRDTLFAYCSANGTFNGNAPAAENRSAICRKAFGFSDFENKIAPETTAVMSLGSEPNPLAACPAVRAHVETGNSADEDSLADPIGYIRRSLQEYPIVCLAEGGHQAEEPHQFLRRVLSDKTILEIVDVVIVEFAAARHQSVLDAYIRGEEVPFSELSKVWRDTGQSPRSPWDSPLYFELLGLIRGGNRTLPPGKRVRVVAGDPPIYWERISTKAEYERAVIPRDPFVASLAIQHAFDLGQKVLIIFGGAHLPKVPVGPDDDPRNSLSYRILKKHPGALRVIEFLDPDNLGIGDRGRDLIRDKIYVTANTWVGGIRADRFFSEIYTLVTDSKTGQQAWQKVPLYSKYLLRDLFDALVYIGPSSEWHYVPASFDEKRDEDYVKELNRRSLIRFGRALDSSR